MEIKRVKELATEIFKTIINLNSDFMKSIWTTTQNARLRPYDLIATKILQTTAEKYQNFRYKLFKSIQNL